MMGTRAYPTGFNKLPSLYVWNGTLPYTTNGTTACATANSDSTSLLTFTVTTTATFSSHVLSTSTYLLTQTVTGATPLPSVDNLPTQSVYKLDAQDPKGWTYCYDFGEPSSPEENFYSLFTGDLFDQVRQNCTPDGMKPAPLVVVDAAAFLLDETTSYIKNSKTENPENLRSRTTETSQTSTDVVADPFQTTSSPSSIQKSTSLEEAETKPSETKPSETEPSENKPSETKPSETKPSETKLSETKPSETKLSNTKPSVTTPSTITKLPPAVLPNTISGTTSNQPVSDNESIEPAHTMAPSSEFKEPSVTATAIKPSAHGADNSQGAGQQNPATISESQPSPKSSAATKTIATSASVQIDALNSLIQDIGQLQSSSQGGVMVSPAGSPTETVPRPSDARVAVTTSVLPAPIVIGTSTATVNSDGNYVIGTHALQPTDSPYEFEGTTYAFDSSKSALIVNGVSTYEVASPQHVSDVHQAATLTINGVTVTPNSVSNYIFETQTLRPGGPAITVSGTRISLASHATALVIGSQTSVPSSTMGAYAVEPALQHTSNILQPAALTINGMTVTPNSASAYVVETQTLQPGGPAIMVSGTRISLASDAAAVVIGSQTSLLSKAMDTYAVEPASQHASDIPQAATLTINGVTVTANSASNYVFETQTLQPGGPAITVSGTRISLASDAAAVVVGSQTSALSTTLGVGDYVWAGLAGMLSAASDTASSLSSTADEELSNASTSASSSSSSIVLESSQSPSIQEGSLLPSPTPTASDSETTFDDSSASLSAATDPTNTGPSTTNHVSQQQIPTSSTDPSTTSQVKPDGPDASSSLSFSLSSPSSSSSSNSTKVSSENNSGRVASGASLAIGILSLIVILFA
jgi:uncharacterized protein YodC (DUF2158 family)